MKKLTITKSSSDYTLKKPQRINLPEPRNEMEEQTQQFILKAKKISSISDLLTLTFENASTMKLARHLLFHRTASESTLFNYTYSIHRFCRFLGTTPDQLINECTCSTGILNRKAVFETRLKLEDFETSLRFENHLTPKSVYGHINNIKTFFKINDVKLKLPYSLNRWTVYEDRAPTIEELQKVISVSDLRQKVIIAMLATGGFRMATLAKLQYRHVKKISKTTQFPFISTLRQK